MRAWVFTADQLEAALQTWELGLHENVRAYITGDIRAFLTSEQAAPLRMAEIPFPAAAQQEELEKREAERKK